MLYCKHDGSADLHVEIESFQLRAHDEVVVVLHQVLREEGERYTSPNCRTTCTAMLCPPPEVLATSLQIKGWLGTDRRDCLG